MNKNEDDIQYGLLDGLSIFSDVLQILNYIENTRQSSNDVLLSELQKQDRVYLSRLVEDGKKILDNQSKIISDLDLIKSNLNIIERVN